MAHHSIIELFRICRAFMEYAPFLQKINELKSEDWLFHSHLTIHNLQKETADFIINSYKETAVLIGYV